MVVVVCFVFLGCFFGLFFWVGLWGDLMFVYGDDMGGVGWVGVGCDD